mmetsp:Transcript_6438/g.19503  ORF Transcript_6438/g.19503 Transcript_6438/m.19503 type:complete len:231 (-) Transcript_6438:1049-1741(-)
MWIASSASVSCAPCEAVAVTLRMVCSRRVSRLRSSPVVARALSHPGLRRGANTPRARAPRRRRRRRRNTRANPPQDDTPQTRTQTRTRTRTRTLTLMRCDWSQTPDRVQHIWATWAASLTKAAPTKALRQSSGGGTAPSSSEACVRSAPCQLRSSRRPIRRFVRRLRTTVRCGGRPARRRRTLWMRCAATATTSVTTALGSTATIRSGSRCVADSPPRLLPPRRNAAPLW